jgi:AAA+ ATPase superfamily predicted ATPase
MKKIIGRKEEIKLLGDALASKKAGLVAIYGRRRIGKTYLIHTYFEDRIAFALTGQYKASLKTQLQQFSKELQDVTGSALALKSPDSWVDAFHALEQYLATKDKRKKWVIFFDELPWLDGRKSGFLSAFEHFWNTWASRQSNMLVVVCGSAASWMIRNIAGDKGGLHNRITQKIQLLPLTLTETEQYMKYLGNPMDRYQIIQLYMAFGGIPPYLDTAGKDNSAQQAIEKSCFSKDGLLRGEFTNLYDSLFDMADNHITVVRALADTTKGLTRQEIIDTCKLSSGGRTTEMLEELEESGFIASYIPFGKTTKDAVYRLVDEFSIFYLKFMDGTRNTGKGAWAKLSTGASYIIWNGMAFEAVCLKHVEQIKEALNIGSYKTEESVWRYVPAKGKKEKGAQIDLLIDRSDKSINICEMKFYNDKYAIDKSYAGELQRKLDVFKGKTNTKKTLYLTMITTYGLKENDYADQLVKKSLTMDALFD